jgi:hypothetical protein
MSKFMVGVGLALLTLGAYLLLSLDTPTRAQLESAYGDPAGSSQKIGGWVCLVAGALILVVGLVRAMKPRHDPDLPPQYRV